MWKFNFKVGSEQYFKYFREVRAGLTNACER